MLELESWVHHDRPGSRGDRLKNHFGTKILNLGPHWEYVWELIWERFWE
jgi:hypothetical protein